jgi:hypothetical protein
MLFARAMSNGVKWFTPDIYEMPVYVPEEMAQVTEDVPAQVVETPTSSAPKLRTLNDEQFQAMMLKIRAGEFLKDGVTLVRDWAIANVHLTPEQIAQFTPAEPTTDNNDFEL